MVFFGATLLTEKWREKVLGILVDSKDKNAVWHFGIGKEKLTIFLS